MSHGQRGFTLVEVLVVVGIMGVVAGGMSSLLLLQQKGQAGLRFRTEVENMQSEIRENLGKSAACHSSIGSVGLAPATTYDVNSIRSGAGTILIPKDTPLNDRAVMITGINVSGYEDTVAPSGTARLTVTYTSPTEILGPSTLVRSFNIATVKDASGELTSCAPIAGSGGGGSSWVPSPLNTNNIGYLLGDVGIGTDSPFSTAFSAGAHTGLHIHREGSGAALRLSSSHDNSRHTYIEGVASRGTASAPLPLRQDDTILSIRGVGSFDGPGIYAGRAASIDMEVDLAPTDNVPTRLVFGTTPQISGVGNAVERMRIDSSGNVGIGTSSPTSKLDVNGSTNLNGLVKLGPYGVPFYGGTGACRISMAAITTSAAAYTCDGVPASTDVVVNCSGTQAMTTPAAVYCRASGDANVVACNTTVPNSVSMDWICSWIYLPPPS